MDFYNDAASDAYITSRTTWIDMPMEGGHVSRKVIVVSSAESQYWVVAYTILTASIFAALTNLAMSLVLTCFPLRHDGNCHAMLVAYYNTDTPFSSLSQMGKFVYHSVFSSRRQIDVEGGQRKKKVWAVNWNTLRWALVLASVSGILIITGLATPFFVGGKALVVRHAAQANSNQMYYPTTPGGTTPGIGTFDQLRPVRSPAAFQALGRVAAARENLEKTINMTIEEGDDPNGRGRTIELSYSYTINGSDMGLQHATGLVYGVSGHCTTEYDWLWTNYTDRDWYPLWNATLSNSDRLNSVHISNDSALPPFVNIVNSMLSTALLSQVNRSQGWGFAMVPNTSGRRSATNNTNDPWFLTENNPDWNATLAPTTRYRVRRGRPPVRCWQNDTWSLGSNRVYDVQDIGKLDGLRLSPFFRDRVFQAEFFVPPMVQLATNLGYSWMNAAIYTTANTKSFDASNCNTTAELVRLVQLGFLASREVVRNTVQVYSPLLKQPGALPNWAAENGSVPAEAADFIIESQDVAAMQVVSIIVVPCLSAVLWLIVFIRGQLQFGGLTLRTGSLAARYTRRAITLQATQLYRLLDESISGKERWSGRTSVPYIRDVPDGQAGEKGGTTSLFIRPKLVPVSTTTVQPELTPVSTTTVQPKLVPVSATTVPPELPPVSTTTVPPPAWGKSAAAISNHAVTDTKQSHDTDQVEPNDTEGTNEPFLRRLSNILRRSKPPTPLFELKMATAWQDLEAGQSGKIRDHFDQ